MTVKEQAKKCLYNFFVITALVNIAIFVLGSTFNKGAMFSYDAFLAPPVYGILGTIPEWITYSRKELSARQMLIRKIIQVIVLELMLILLTFTGSNPAPADAPVIISFAISVFVIYMLVVALSWLMDGRKAKSMMAELKEYQKIHSSDGE